MDQQRERVIRKVLSLYLVIGCADIEERCNHTHVDIFKCLGREKDFPRRGETFPPKFRLILPKFYFFSTWEIFLFHVRIFDFLRGEQFSRFVVSVFCRTGVNTKKKSW